MENQNALLLRGDRAGTGELLPWCFGGYDSRIHDDSAADSVYEHHSKFLLPLAAVHSRHDSFFHLRNFQHVWANNSPDQQTNSSNLQTSLT